LLSKVLVEANLAIIAMRGRCAFKKSDVTRATSAVLATGLGVARVEVRKDAILVIPGKPAEESDERAAPNEWDEVLNAPNKKRTP
jgi:hypothetical protein